MQMQMDSVEKILFSYYVTKIISNYIILYFVLLSCYSYFEDSDHIFIKSFQ